MSSLGRKEVEGGREGGSGGREAGRQEVKRLKVFTSNILPTKEEDHTQHCTLRRHQLLLLCGAAPPAAAINHPEAIINPSQS